MIQKRNHNAFVVLTTLSVCLGLMLVGSGAGVSSQTVQGNANLRVIVRQSLYGDALEEIVRELERLREAGEHVSIDEGLLNSETLLSLANLNEFVSKYGDLFIGHSPYSVSAPTAELYSTDSQTAPLIANGSENLNRPPLTVSNLARASLDS